MYKAFQNKKYYLAFNKFRRTAKNPPWNQTYLNGFRKIESDDMTSWYLVLGVFRVIFGIKKSQLDSSM